MARESRKSDYSDDEIEQILGMGISQTGLPIREIRELIIENPILATGLAFAFGILLGVSLGCARRTCSRD